MAGEKLLTDAQCKAAKPKEKIYYLSVATLLSKARPSASITVAAVQVARPLKAKLVR